MPTKAQQQRKRITPKARVIERRYALQLRRIARHIGELINAFPPDDPASIPLMQSALLKYAETITPWAEAVGARMIFDVAQKDEQEWAERSASLSRNLRREIGEAPTGAIRRDLLEEQVSLITSLPRDAAQRVHELATGALLESNRASSLVESIRRSGDVSISRANLIARTEVARSAATLTQARAQHIGSEGYIWRTSLDSNVRPLHKKLEASPHRWDTPPVSGEKGERSHPGCIYNCRCWAEVIVPGLE